MKLSRVDFVRPVCVPAGRDNGRGTGRTDVREQTYTLDDGWTIEEVSPKSVTLFRDGAFARVEGVGYSCVPIFEESPTVVLETIESASAAKGKKR